MPHVSERRLVEERFPLLVLLERGWGHDFTVTIEFRKTYKDQDRLTMKNLQIDNLKDKLETCERRVYAQVFADMKEQTDLKKDEIAEPRRELGEAEGERLRSKLRLSKAAEAGEDQILETSTQTVEQQCGGTAR
jgi:hypothetical protein